MAYLWAPEHCTEVSVRLEWTLSGGAHHCETIRFESERDGKELTNQLADLIASAMHLACAGRSTKGKEVKP